VAGTPEPRRIFALARLSSTPEGRSIVVLAKERAVVHHQMAERTQIQLQAVTHMFSKLCRFRGPVALAFVWRMPDARSVRASATRGGRESAQCLVPVHYSTRQ